MGIKRTRNCVAEYYVAYIQYYIRFNFTIIGFFVILGFADCRRGAK
jgi:hypothetical protein